MKFDKLMNILYRIICVITGIIVIVGFCVSCFGKSISACADVGLPDWAFPYEQYTESYEERLEDIQKSNGPLSQILNDPNVTQDAKNNALLAYALQSFDFKLAYGVFQNWQNNDFEDVPDTVSVSGGGLTGIYQSYKDDKYHGIILTSGGDSISSPVATSDEFSLHFAIDSNIDITGSVSSSFSDTNVNYSCVYTRPSSATFTISFPNDSYFTSGYSETYTFGAGTSATNLRLGLSSSYIPILSVSLPWSNYVSKSNRLIIGGYGQTVTLPSDTIDSESPWEYYNDTLLPYIHNNFTNNQFDIDDILAFPNGYNVPVPPDPTEPQTFPNGGINIGSNNNIDIDFNIIIPTDSNGQPVTEWVTNESGETIATETITETVYNTEDCPDDAKYNVFMPTFEEIRMDDATLPPMDISSFGDGIGFIWNACYHILTDSGFMPVVMACIGISICTFVIWKLGG